MKDVTFGQYYPATSFVHKMDARIKILISIAYIVAVFLVSSYHFLGFAACLLFVMAATAFSRVPFLRVLKSIKGVLFFVIFSAVLQLFFNKSGTPLWENGFITDIGLLSAGFIVARITLVVLGASVLTLTTSPVELADGIESLLYPLKLIKFPVHEFALIMSIALRFIPTLLDETDRIIKAQKARGADFESGNIFQRARALVPILVPLFISAFRRADELATAMECRCYHGGQGRTALHVLRYRAVDIWVLLGFIALTAGIIALGRLGI